MKGLSGHNYVTTVLQLRKYTRDYKVRDISSAAITVVAIMLSWRSILCNQLIRERIVMHLKLGSYGSLMQTFGGVRVVSWETRKKVITNSMGEECSEMLFMEICGICSFDICVEPIQVLLSALTTKRECLQACCFFFRDRCVSESSCAMALLLRSDLPHSCRHLCWSFL